MEHPDNDAKMALQNALPEEFKPLCHNLDLSPFDQDSSFYAILRQLEGCGKLDFEDYTNRYPDVARSGVDPVWHFFRHGIWEKRKINSKKNVFSDPERVDVQGYPQISVLVPVYNNAIYLQECFDSILNQTFKDIEMLILDDGSTDQAAIGIMDNYVAKDGRTKLIRKTNSGYGHTMNIGLKEAKGKYIAIVESDDYIDLDALRQMYEICERENLDFVKTDFERFFGNEHRRFVHADIFKDKSKYNIVLDTLDLSARYYDIVNVIWNAIYRREFLIKNNIRFNETPGASFQDNGFYFLAYIHARRFMLSDISTYRLRRDNPGSSFYSTDKMFAIWNEYNYIYQILMRDSDLYNKFIKVYHYKKFLNLDFALTHIKPGEEHILLDKFRADFIKALGRDELDKVIFGNGYKKLLAILAGNYTSVIPHKPELSIILTVYNKEKYLVQTLDSILKQTHKDFEIIIVDDGSSDNSVKIVNEYAAKDNRIKLFIQANMGPGGARNTGLKNASGKYVIILDADDLIYPDFCKLMVESIAKSDADFCVCESESLNELTGEVSQIHYALNWHMLPPKACFSPEEIKGNIFRAFCGWAWDKIYKKSFLDSEGITFPDVAFSEDMVFVLEGVAKASRIGTVNKVLIKHRHFVANSVSNTREANPVDFIKGLHILRDFMIRHSLYRKFERDFLSYALHYYNWNITTLYGKSVETVAHQKTKFSHDFNIESHPRSYYYDTNEFDTFFSI